MIEMVVVIAVGLVALVFIANYVYNQLTNPCRGCSDKSCDGCRNKH